MALKDLVSDLSNFNGSSQYDKLDGQIKTGVNFIPDDDARGFTPKTDLESLYHKANSQYSAKEFIPESDGQFSQTWGNNFPTQFTTDFMTTPIADYVSKFNPPTNDSLTFEVGDYTFNNAPRIVGAHGSDFMNTPILDFEGIYTPPENITKTFNLEPKNTGIDFTKWSDGFAAIGDSVTKYASLIPIQNRRSQFSSNETPNHTGRNSILPDGLDIQLTLGPIPQVYHTGRVSSKTDANYNTAKNEGPFNWQSSFAPDPLNAESNLDKINDKIKFDGHNTTSGQFVNVPAGLDENMKMMTKNYREVSDPWTIEKNRQPFILRAIPGHSDDPNGSFDGSNGSFTYPGRGRWGFDPIVTDNGNIPFEGGSSTFRGAPTLSGLIERNAVDKVRISKFLVTPAGIEFLTKQAALQFLNPTLETKWYNPASVLGIPTTALFSGFDAFVKDRGINSVLDLLGTGALPVVHAQRHFEATAEVDTDFGTINLGVGANYESVIKDTAGGKGRLHYQAKAFSTEISGWDIPDIPKGKSKILNAVKKEVNKQLNKLEDKVSAISAGPTIALSNPNKYLGLVSTAPITLKNGLPSFIGSPFQAVYDAGEIHTKKGGVFNEKSRIIGGDPKIKQHSTLQYGHLFKEKGKANKSYGENLLTPTEINMVQISDDRGWDKDSIHERRQKENKKVLKTGDVGLIKNQIAREDITLKGRIKKQGGKYLTDAVDKVNMIPYGADTLPGESPNPDFIKFKFRDMVNNKWIIFRAILEGISDSITPEYGEERYVGRPDKVYIYQGADRNISFTFSIYPKTKQELPVLMEKLNYLVGLCYPSFTESQRMITPFMSLTIGDMFNNTPGLLSSLNITVEDTSTWEISEGLQFPHYIKAACEFKYIGDNVLASKGKHYGLAWTPDGKESKQFSHDGENNVQRNRFANRYDLGYNDYPNRRPNTGTDMAVDVKPIFEELGQV